VKQLFAASILEKPYRSADFAASVKKENVNWKGLAC
jgi:hypothetical protein